MELQNAIQLIEKAVDTRQPNQRWADLGAGSGLFSTALSHLLTGPGKIYAVDKNSRPINSSTGNTKAVEIISLEADFTRDDLSIEKLDGILMANSLHYVQEQFIFLQAMQQLLHPSGRFIIVEYDTDQPNQWVPYPVSFSKLQQIVHALKNVTVEKIATQPSMYRSAGLYAALIKQG